MDRPKFHAGRPDAALVRQVVFQRLRQQPGWEQLEPDKGFDAFVEIEGRDQYNLGPNFDRCLLDVFWALVAEGILAPGKNVDLGGHMQNLPWFHRTAYGEKVIAAGEYVPHDKTGYFLRLNTEIPHIDQTVVAYLDESLGTFLNGNLVASMVMLGVAAERVFDLVCESLAPALADVAERTQFEKLVPLRSVRKRLDWVRDKLRRMEDGKMPVGYPDRASLMITAVYDLMRVQRNDLGHPQADPPRPSRDAANAHLEIFPSFYATAEALRTFLATNKI